jgi:hypothetical protein
VISHYNRRMTSDPASRIAALEAAVADLRDELKRVRNSRRRSMRDTHRCPMCGATRILHFRNVRDVAQNQMVSFALQKQYSAWWGLKDVAGALEAFACRGCRLVEWHAISLEGVEVDGEEVVELEPPAEPDPGASPYR